MPYLTAWHRAYRDLGVVFVGVHAPEFAFAKDKRQVEAAVRRLGIEYPVVTDNDYQTWDAFANRYWPTIYLIDAEGYIRYQHHGEGGYEETEAALQNLVREAAFPRGKDAHASLPRPLEVLRAEDQPGAVCFRTTPELHAGYHRGALGNPEGYPPPGLPLLYRFPLQHLDGYYYANGLWHATDEALALAGQHGRLALPYHAATANAVLSPSMDVVELMLNLKAPAVVEVTQDGQPLDALSAGEDVHFREGKSVIVVDAPRMYQIARNPDARPHELQLEINAPGVALYAFSFSSCTVPR